MPPSVASLAVLIGILILFWLDRDRDAHTSWALWIPVVWLAIVGSRPVSVWLGMGPAGDSSDYYLDGSPLDRVVYSLVLVAGVVVLITRGRQVAALLRTNAPILVFLFYCATSSLWSEFPDVAFKRWIKSLGDIVMVLIVLTEPDRIAAIKRFLARTGFVLIPASVLLIRYYSDLGRAYSKWDGTQSYVGVASDKNMLGMTCLVIGLGTVWRLTEWFRSIKAERKRGPLVAQLILLSMVLWLLWKANSVTSLSCFAMASALIVATSFSTIARKRVLVNLAVISMLAVAISALFLNTGGGLVQSLGRDPTLTGRTAIWRHLIDMTPNQFVGAGFESFWLGPRLERIWAVIQFHVNEAHNGYLEVYLNLGWVGVALLLVVIAAAYKSAMSGLRRDPVLGRLLLAYVFTAMVYSFTEAGFRMLSPIWIFFLLSTVFARETSLEPYARQQAEVLANRSRSIATQRYAPNVPRAKVRQS